ncbi:MAG TPA: 4-hydroxythreonine-4-phosphate dehydrogenase PdxA, partial [Kofleriaceae bacterium]|nr:4-hydroxythreonine-4-phosphate dehydrogenase PdxA [Kofleriaceae bacterium]
MMDEERRRCFNFSRRAGAGGVAPVAPVPRGEAAAPREMYRLRMLGVTLGDPAGIGPEIAAWALADAPAALRKDVIVFGDPAVLARGARATGVTVDDVACEGEPCSTAPGRPDLAGGVAQVAWLEAAIAAARAGRIDGLVTAPISKTWATRAGLAFPGHTELLADRLGAPDVAMTFV